MAARLDGLAEEGRERSLSQPATYLKNGDSAVSHCHPPELRDVERVVGDVLAGVRVLGALDDDASLEELGDVDGHGEDDDGDGVGGHALRHAEAGGREGQQD